jgi:hypothetical protein
MSEELGLPDDEGGRGFLLVRWVAVAAEGAADETAQVSADLLAAGPVDRGVLTDGLGDLAGDDPELIVAEDVDGALVGAEGIVEGDLILGETETVAARMGLLHLGGEVNQGGFHSAVMVAG